VKACEQMPLLPGSLLLLLLLGPAVLQPAAPQ
jgi:hypothetical protein